MANPQKENGYTPISNDIMEALAKFRIPGEAMQVLMVIFRKTYGFNKKEDSIPLSQFQLSTGMKRSSVVRAIKKLILFNMVVTKKLLGSSNIATTLPTIYSFQKNYELWRVVSKELLGSSHFVQKAVTKKLPSKDNIELKTNTLGHFSEFWSIYPRKVKKSEALKSWNKINPTNGTIEAILKALQWQIKSPDWTKDNGQFIPHPSTYLNQSRWEDEPIKSQQRLPI
jgi:phage replication O-like protein O